MNAELSDSQLYTSATGALNGFLNLDPLVASIQKVLNNYQPAVYAIAFVLLTVGTMREFFYPETRRFLEAVLRAVLLVASISFAPNIIAWGDQAAQALSELPAAGEVNLGDWSYSLKPGQAPAITQLEQVLQAKIQGSGSANGVSGKEAGDNQKSPQFSSNPLDFGRDVGIAWSYIAGFTQNLVWEILFAIYLLCLLLCKVIILLMQFVQKVVVIGFRLYTPIAIAEYAHRSLKSKAVGFFLSFVGILSWPVGWSVVNSVTLGIFKSLPAPQNQNFATLMIAIVLAIPVLLWVLIGHVAAPIFVQKVVIRGGATIQGFVGTMVSAIGASSMAIFSSGLAGSAGWLGSMKPGAGAGQMGPAAQPGDYPADPGAGEYFVEPSSVTAEDPSESGGQSRTPLFRHAKGQEQVMPGLSNAGSGVLEAGATMMNRFGSVARFVGHAVVEGSGEMSGLEYRAIAAFGPSGRNSRTFPNQANRSSLQARRYIDEF
ncbi:MAG: hypothetical protein JO279_08545 [Verrucomicrobia bacterium]|nr:hypothetical protein [Verrucomicrobiota bacterium]